MYIRPDQLRKNGEIMATCQSKMSKTEKGDVFVMNFRDSIARKHIKAYIEEWKYSRNQGGDLPLERPDYDFYCAVINMLGKHNVD